MSLTDPQSAIKLNFENCTYLVCLPKIALSPRRTFNRLCLSQNTREKQYYNAMTIPYEGSFLKAVFRWHGSVWKAIWRELLVWLLFYYGLRTLIVYYPFTRTERKTLNEIVKQFGDYTRSIPVEFLLGFYVTQTVGRWWSQVIFSVYI